MPPVGTVTWALTATDPSDPYETLAGVTEVVSTTGLRFTVKGTDAEVDPVTPFPPA
jgi:hypothetical protein